MSKEFDDFMKSVEDDVEKLAEEMYGKGKVPDYEEGFIDGYNKAKETLYTEEQVEKLMYWTAKMTLGVWHSCKSEAKIIDELESKIQSLKQPKQ